MFLQQGKRYLVVRHKLSIAHAIPKLVAGSGAEALEILGSPVEVDALLTDLVLPGGIDGFELIKEALRIRPKLAVLPMSGYATPKLQRDRLSIQNITLLEKPFSLIRLAEALNEMLV